MPVYTIFTRKSPHARSFLRLLETQSLAHLLRGVPCLLVRPLAEQIH
jgi:hypothetical protein